MAEINRAAARIARQALGAHEGYVLGDVGPVGGMLEPYGDLTVEEAGAALAQQAQALVEGGVDAVILETQASLEELSLGIQGAKEAANIIGSCCGSTPEHTRAIRAVVDRFNAGTKG